MPFTPAHAAVALPFVRTPLLPAAIAVGAMAPDVPLFVRGTPVTYQLTHTNVLVSGLVALLLLVLWYGLFRPAVRELSPRWLAERLPAEWDRAGADAWHAVREPRPGARHGVWRESGVFAVLVAVSLVLGVLSHIAWDAFTHEGRWGLALFPALDETWGPLPGFKWLQYGSGVGGVAVLAIFGAVWILRRSRLAPPRVLPPAVRWSWWASLPVALIVAWLIGSAVYGPDPEVTSHHLAYRVLPPACAVWALLTAVLCAWILARRRALS